MADQKTQLIVAAQDYTPSQPSIGLLTNPTPRTGYKQSLFRLRQGAHKFWILEVSASILSLLIFVAIIITLHRFNNTIYGDATTISSNMTKRPILFPALAIMSAVMRATMLLPVATAIGQLKWSWFRSSRRLIDIERFDDAARGILGSAKLMFFLRFRNIAAVGAALTILALPLDAVIQSSVLLPSKLESVNSLNRMPEYSGLYKNETFLERATSYTASQLMTTGDDVWPEPPMINAVSFGQGYGNGLADILKAETIVNCPTGYCQFNTAQTLSIGYQCINRTDIVYVPTNGTSAPYQMLPGTNLKFYLEGNVYAKDQRIAAESYSSWPTKNYPDYEQEYFNATHGPLIVRTAMLIDLGNGISDKSDNNGTFGIECALFWEVKTTQMYVNASDPNSNSSLASHDTPIQFNIDHGNASEDALWLLTPKTCIVEGREVAVSSDEYYMDNCVHLVGRKAALGLQNMLMDLQYGLMGYLFLSETYANGTVKWTQRNIFTININRSSWNQLPAAVFDNIKTMWGNIAYAASFTVRRTKSVQTKGGAAKLYVTGSTSALVFYYSVDWARLTMPAFIVLCCALFVLYAALLTRKEYAWRRSALPLLFHGLEDHERFAQGDVRDFNVMQDIAQEIRVKLTENVDANGARFITQN